MSYFREFTGLRGRVFVNCNLVAIVRPSLRADLPEQSNGQPWTELVLANARKPVHVVGDVVDVVSAVELTANRGQRTEDETRRRVDALEQLIH